jgi:hypothetical protein
MLIRHRPIAAGSGAILLSINPNLNPIELRDLMIRSATHYPSPDNDIGYGTVDLVTALNLMTAEPQVEVTDFKVTPADGRNLISWTAHIEIENSFWLVERRTDDSPPEEIARVEGNIYSLQMKEYEILDKNISGGEHLEYILVAHTGYSGAGRV